MAGPSGLDDPDAIRMWRDGITALASVGTVHCKLSGLAMAVHTFDPEAQRPFFEHCLTSFGVDRCMFGSNFPVDALYGTFDELMKCHQACLAGLSDTERRQVLATNGERSYRI